MDWSVLTSLQIVSGNSSLLFHVFCSKLWLCCIHIYIYIHIIIYHIKAYACILIIDIIWCIHWYMYKYVYNVYLYMNISTVYIYIWIIYLWIDMCTKKIYIYIHKYIYIYIFIHKYICISYLGFYLYYV